MVLNLTIAISKGIILGTIAIIMLSFLPLSSFADPQITMVELGEADDYEDKDNITSNNKFIILTFGNAPRQPVCICQTYFG